MESSTAFLNGDILGSSHITTGTETISGNIAPSIKKLNTGLFIFISLRVTSVGDARFSISYDGVDITATNVIPLPNTFTGGSPYYGTFLYYVSKCEDSSKALEVSADITSPGVVDAFAVSYAFVSNVPKNQIYKEATYSKEASRNIF